jgi:outer membrane biosynthesis protein TonB
MTTGARLPALLAAAAVCLPLAACGDDDVGDPIPAAKVNRLETEFDAVRDHVADDRCDEAQTAVNQARTTADTLDDDGVGSDVQDAIGDGVDNLGSLVSEECQKEEPVETTPETVPEPTTPETTTETTPEPTTPEPTTPEPTTPETTTTEPAPDEGTGGAQFDPNAIPPGQEKKFGDGD